MSEHLTEGAVLSEPHKTESHKHDSLLPREHGATAMLFTPMLCAAILLREWRWTELATFSAVVAALEAREPLLVLARQHFVWKQPHPETGAAWRWLFGWLAVLAVCGRALTTTWPVEAMAAFGVGAAAFLLLTVAVTVKNRQRSTLFQLFGAVALTSTSVAISLSVSGFVETWCWWLWLLMAMQSAAGILVVHARLDARIASRGTVPAPQVNRRAAWAALGLMAGAAIPAAMQGSGWIAGALLLAAAGYSYELRCQRDPGNLQLPLTTVGLRALALAMLFAALVTRGLWQ